VGAARIDIDILLISNSEGDIKIKIDNRLIVPHPGLFEREFFLKTVSEIDYGHLSQLLKHSFQMLS
jgi:7,8-dihydro-6-hydroxymethylpterin-pyrophosphokinase